MLRTALLAAGLFACACNRPMPQTAMVGVTPAAQPTQCAADADCGGQQLCVNRACYDVATATACGEHPIHFATGSAALDARNRPELDRIAVCLRSERNVAVTVSGSADERGARDYNVDLAQRRANTVASYLEAAGVSPKQLTALSYGPDKPICAEHDRECWRQNRRVDIATTRDVDSVKNKKTTDDDTSHGQRIDGTGNGSDNGGPLGK